MRIFNVKTYNDDLETLYQHFAHILPRKARQKLKGRRIALHCSFRQRQRKTLRIISVFRILGINVRTIGKTENKVRNDRYERMPEILERGW